MARSVVESPLTREERDEREKAEREKREKRERELRELREEAERREEQERETESEKAERDDVHGSIVAAGPRAPRRGKAHRLLWLLVVLALVATTSAAVSTHRLAPWLDALADAVR